MTDCERCGLPATKCVTAYERGANPAYGSYRYDYCDACAEQARSWEGYAVEVRAIDRPASHHVAQLEALGVLPTTGER